MLFHLARTSPSTAITFGRQNHSKMPLVPSGIHAQHSSTRLSVQFGEILRAPDCGVMIDGIAVAACGDTRRKFDGASTQRQEPGTRRSAILSAEIGSAASSNEDQENVCAHHGRNSWLNVISAKPLSCSICPQQAFFVCGGTSMAIAPFLLHAGKVISSKRLAY